MSPKEPAGDTIHTIHEYLMNEWASWVQQGHTTLSYTEWLDFLRDTKTLEGKKERLDSSLGNGFGNKVAGESL